MTGKVKIAVALVLLAALFAGGFVAGWRTNSRLCREAELSIMLSKETARRESVEKENSSLRQAMTVISEQKQKPPVQKSLWRTKQSNEKLNTPPPDCKKCLGQVRREVEVKDDARGWWTYKDDNVLDEDPGMFSLTPRFFAEAVTPAGPDDSDRRSNPQPSHPIPPTKPFSLSPPEKSVRAGVGLTTYELEFGYDPVIIQGARADVSLGLRSRVSLDRYDSTMRGDLSAGVEIRW